MSLESRDSILDRVRRALKAPAPPPHWSHAPADEGPLFPLPENNRRALCERFLAELAMVHGEGFELDGASAAAAWIANVTGAFGDGGFLAVDHPLVRGAMNGQNNVHWVDATGPGSRGWEGFDVGVTPAEALVAESGTILVSAALCGRAPSLLPPIHLVIATTDQVCPDLDSAFRLMRERYPDRLPSTFSFITGPSRTADIEKILVLGAHGPRRLIVLLLPQGDATS